MTDYNSGWNATFTSIVREMYALLKACPRKALLACSTVNPRHPIPQDHLELVAAINSTDNVDQKIYISEYVKAIIKLFSIAILQVGQIIFLNLRYYNKIGKYFREDANVIIKTWFVSNSGNEKEDFYFGNLGELLEKEGLSYKIIGKDPAQKFCFSFSNDLSDKIINTVPELALIPVWAPVFIFFDQLITSYLLTRILDENKNSTFLSVTKRASIECLSLLTFTHSLQFYIAKNAVENFKAKAYITLYEGQPWEKVSWLGAKAANSNCLLVGYQHTVIMRHALALLSPNLNSWEYSAPEIVLSLGKTTISMMEEGHEPLGTTFIPVGSFRNKSNKLITNKPKPSAKSVLVVPEGIMDEACLLFERAAEMAKMLPDHHFIFRCHPVLPFESISSELTFDVSTISNIEVSRYDLEEDFDRCSVVLYRGSSVALNAVLNGLKAYYFNESGTPNVNPFYQFDNWFESISSIEEAVRLFSLYATQNTEDVTGDWLNTRNILDEYTRPIDEQAIKTFATMLKEN